VCTTGDTAHIDEIFKFLPHTSTCWRVCGKNLNIVSMCTVSPVVHTSNISSCKKKLFRFSCVCEKFHEGMSFGFLVINVCNHREHYETPCICTECASSGYIALERFFTYSSRLKTVTSSNAIYSRLSVGIITTDRSAPSVDWRIRCCCNYISNCVTTKELTGVLYYKTPIQQFCFFLFFVFNWRIYLLQKEGKKGNTNKNTVSTSYLRKKMEQNSDSSW